MRSLATVLFLCLLSFSSAQEIKVISFNIRYYNQTDGNDIWDLRKDAALEFITYENPDFFGLQEAVLKQITDFEDGTAGYQWVGVGRDDGKQGGEFTPLFYKANVWKLLDSNTFWLSTTPEVPSKDWDAALPRICTWGRFRHRETSKELLVLNTHFDHVGNVARQKSAELLLSKLADLGFTELSVLMGDFNLEPNSVPIEILSENLNDTFARTRVRYGEIGTFNGFTINEIPKRRIDYVFVGDQFDVNAYTVDSRIIDGRFLSDHFPVIVQLKMK